MLYDIKYTCKNVSNIALIMQVIAFPSQKIELTNFDLYHNVSQLAIFHFQHIVA